MAEAEAKKVLLVDDVEFIVDVMKSYLPICMHKFMEDHTGDREHAGCMNHCNDGSNQR